MAQTTDEKFNQLVRLHELNPKIARDLKRVLSTCEVVLLCDDSGSMNSIVTGKTTRWMELKKLAEIVITYVTSINSNGLDIYFLNRPTIRGVASTAVLQSSFSEAPNDGTPLCSTLKRIFSDKSGIGRELLVVVVTDGEPSDGSIEDLRGILLRKPSNVHVSLAECTDNERTMDYLDEWDREIPNFDNTDDYRVEVKRLRGQNFKFDYNDYVIKILLATFIKSYFNIDQQNPIKNCCTIL